MYPSVHLTARTHASKRASGDGPTRDARSVSEVPNSLAQWRLPSSSQREGRNNHRETRRGVTKRRNTPRGAARETASSHTRDRTDILHMGTTEIGTRHDAGGLMPKGHPISRVIAPQPPPIPKLTLSCIATSRWPVATTLPYLARASRPSKHRRWLNLHQKKRGDLYGVEVGCHLP